MPLLTPICSWCGCKWIRKPYMHTAQEVSYRPPATSTRWNSVHLHHSCADEFMSALAEEIGGFTRTGNAISNEFDGKRGQDDNHKTLDSYGDSFISQYYTPAYHRRLENK